MGMPCRHIASVCRGNESILRKDSKGFLFTFIHVFWWNQYYLYGMSTKNDHQKSKEVMIALAANDTRGLPCPGRLDCPSSFSCPDHVFDSFCKPVIDQLLNYPSYDAIRAVQLMQDSMSL
jgi:hypothetical protein